MGKRFNDRILEIIKEYKVKQFAIYGLILVSIDMIISYKIYSSSDEYWNSNIQDTEVAIVDFLLFSLWLISYLYFLLEKFYSANTDG